MRQDGVESAPPGRDSLDATVIRAELSPLLFSGSPLVESPRRVGASADRRPAASWAGMPCGLAIRTEEDEATACLFVSGELDLATSPLLDEVLVAAQHGRITVTVDLGNVTFMDVSGLAVLLNAAKRGGVTGGRLDIVNAQAAVRRIFEATGTASLLGPGDTPSLNDPGAANHRLAELAGHDVLHDLSVPS